MSMEYVNVDYVLDKEENLNLKSTEPNSLIIIKLEKIKRRLKKNFLNDTKSWINLGSKRKLQAKLQHM